MMSLYFYECKQCGHNEIIGGNILFECPICRTRVIVTRICLSNIAMNEDDIRNYESTLASIERDKDSEPL